MAQDEQVPAEVGGVLFREFAVHAEHLFGDGQIAERLHEVVHLQDAAQLVVVVRADELELGDAAPVHLARRFAATFFHEAPAVKKQDKADDDEDREGDQQGLLVAANNVIHWMGSFGVAFAGGAH